VPDHNDKVGIPDGVTQQEYWESLKKGCNEQQVLQPEGFIEK
jgi:hypothetical protein